MDSFNRFVNWYLRHMNKLFWIAFFLAAAVFIYSIFFGYVFLDLVLGLVIIFAGIRWLGQELLNRRIRRVQDDSIRTINELLQWAQKSYDYTRFFKDRHEKRLHNLDVKRARLEEKTEDQFRDAVKKVIQLENKLNKAVKAMGTPAPIPEVPVPVKSRVPAVTRAIVQPRLSDLSPTQRKAIDFLRKKKKITNKEYRESFRVSEKKAYNELYNMYKMGLLKRVGRGRNTHYMLAF